MITRRVSIRRPMQRPSSAASPSMATGRSRCDRLHTSIGVGRSRKSIGRPTGRGIEVLHAREDVHLEADPLQKPIGVRHVKIGSHNDPS